MEKREFTINGRNYAILTPTVRQSMTLANRLVILLGGVTATLKIDSKDGMKKFSEAISTIDPEKLDSLLMDSISYAKLHYGVEAVYNEVGFEKHFDQFREDVYLSCCRCLWECVKDFLPRSLGTFAQGAKEKFLKEFFSQRDGESNGGSDDPSGQECVAGLK